MLITACGELLSRELDAVTDAPPEDTPLGALAGTIRGMARAYADDGATFSARGDLVNAHAAYYYGFGWLHFGFAYGLFTFPGERTPACPFIGPVETLPPAFNEKLTEKTHRYLRLLDTACASVACAPEPDTTPGIFAGRMLLVGTCYAREGKRLFRAGKKEDALACFSYGHGWLDGGVRAGLLAVTGNREIFTI
jgi:hypothetical protein